MKISNTQHKKSNITNSLAAGFMVLLLISLFSCNEWVQVDPPVTQLAGSNVYTSDATATSATVGLYGRMMERTNTLFNGALTLCSGFSSDEFTIQTTNTTYQEYYNNNLVPTNASIDALWTTAYNYIYHANAVLEGLATSTEISPKVHSQLEGEAKLVRAMANFYLLNMFGDVPLVTTTSYSENAQVSRNASADVYARIVQDLKDAQALLGDAYVSANRARPNKATATALLARVYLYQGDWINAELMSKQIIGNSLYKLDTDLNHVFVFDSPETIWQLMPIAPGTTNTGEGFMFVQTSGIPTYGSLSNSLLGSFEPGDARLTKWVKSYVRAPVTYYMPFKYKVKSAATVTEYYVVFRLAEQLLICAEALARQGKVSEAIQQLDKVRQRAGIPLIQVTRPAISANDLLIVIAHERRIELFMEWGHRWLDLKRTNQQNDVLAPKPGWQASDALYPIPLKQILNDPNMTGAQNPGY